MFWNVKKITETEQSIVIGFSKNSSLDGRISFDKRNEHFNIDSVAKDCDGFESERLIQFLYTLIFQNILSFETYSICIG